MIYPTFRSGSRIMKRLLTLLVALSMLAFLPGCETFKGAGRDIEKAGEAIQRAAK
jgi:predicted small secreted protein